MQKYVSLIKAAELEEINYNTMVKKINRSPQQFKIERKANPKGGKDIVYIDISSLSPQAQRKYNSFKAQSIIKQAKSQEKPWYVDIDLHWYMTHYSTHYKEAADIACEMDGFVSGRLKMRAGEFYEYLSEKSGKDTRTIARYMKNYNEAAQIAKIQELKTGMDYGYFKILAMARKPRDGNHFPSITEEVKAFIENTMYDKLFVQNRNPISNLYDDLKAEAEVKGWKIPSYDTVLRYTNYIKDADGGEVFTLLSGGVREWKNQWMQKIERNVFNLKPLEYVQTDGHTFDCFVRVKRANGTWEAVRPILVTMLDTKSRVSLGHVICENPNAQITKNCVINMLYPKKNKELPYGVPKVLLTDRGKEFTAETLTGVNRKTTKYKIIFDEDVEGFFVSASKHDVV